MATEEWHQCHFCGEDVKDGVNPKGERHWLSDCRPDLVEHEIGSRCTWPPTGNLELDAELGRPGCYAYQDRDGNWTEDHKYFWEDAPC